MFCRTGYHAIYSMLLQHVVTVNGTKKTPKNTDCHHRIRVRLLTCVPGRDSDTTPTML